MSYFCAFEGPDEARIQIAAFAERWQSQGGPILNAQWVVPENYHITLKYLGDISSAMVDVAVKSAASSIKAQMIDRAEKGKIHDKVVIEQ